MAERSSIPHPSMFHLRRIPPNKEKKHEQSHNAQGSLILLDSYVKFGRNPDLCHVLLTSSVSSSNMISRDHAEIIGYLGVNGIERYTLTDHSLNGTYINDHRAKSRIPMPIKEGDIIKFGHMNGASIKELQRAPQANAEFAFVVERASQSISYLGFRNGKRTRTIVCHGDVFNCVEGDGKLSDKKIPTKPPKEALRAASLAQTTSPPASAASTSAVSSSSMQQSPLIFPYNLPIGYPNITQNIFSSTNPITQWNLSTMNLSNMANLRANSLLKANTLTSQASTSSSTQLAQRGLIQPDSLNSTIPAVSAPSDSSSKSNNKSANKKDKREQESLVVNLSKSKKEKGVVVKPPLTPPMECDSSVPSPPKQNISVIEEKSRYPVVKIKEIKEDVRSMSSLESSPVIKEDLKRESLSPIIPSIDRNIKLEKEKDKSRDEKPHSAPERKPRKANELAGLLEDLTEGSWANQIKRGSSHARRPTEDVIVEKKAKKEKKKKEKERQKREQEEQIKKSQSANTNSVNASSAIKLPQRRRLKQLSDEESVSSDDSDEEISPRKEPIKRKKEKSVSSSSDECDSDDSQNKAAKKTKKKSRPSKDNHNVGIKKNKNKPKMTTNGYTYSAQAEVDDNGDPVVTHDPEASCGLERGCVHPQDLEVIWICCDGCNTWYHTICILGNTDPPSSEKFFCGCKKSDKAKTKEKKSKKKV